jgi:hypothetical protein
MCPDLRGCGVPTQMYTYIHIYIYISVEIILNLKWYKDFKKAKKEIPGADYIARRLN